MTLQQLEQPVPVALTEDPQDVYRVGNSRVLLELVIRAFQRGESPESIVRAYRSLELPQVNAVIGRYLANPEPFEAYLRQCDQRAESLRQELEQNQPPSISKEQLHIRAKAKGLTT